MYWNLTPVDIRQLSYNSFKKETKIYVLANSEHYLNLGNRNKARPKDLPAIVPYVPPKITKNCAKNGAKNDAKNKKNETASTNKMCPKKDEIPAKKARL